MTGVLSYILPTTLYILWTRCCLRDCDLQLSLLTEDKSYWRGKVVWITGSTSGIGKSLAILLHQRGAHLILSARREDALHSVDQECRTQRSAAATNLLPAARIVSHITQRPDKRNERWSSKSTASTLASCKLISRNSDTRPKNATSNERISLLRDSSAYAGDKSSAQSSCRFRAPSFPSDITPDCTQNSEKKQEQNPVIPSNDFPTPKKTPKLDLISREDLDTAPFDLLPPSQSGTQLPSDVIDDDQPDIFILPLDITNYQQIEKCVEEAIGWKGRVDVLINNAGISQRSLFPPFSVDEMMFQTDLLSHVFITKAVLPYMLARNSGHIINTGSAQSRIILPGRAAYCGAKHALLAYFSAMLLELRATMSNIRITTALPGYIKSELSLRALRNSRPDDSHGIAASGTASQSRTESNLFSPSWVKRPSTPADCSCYVDPKHRRAMEADHCAALILRAASRNIDECWIAKQPELFYLYLSFYFPNFWKWITGMNVHRLLKRNSPSPPNSIPNSGFRQLQSRKSVATRPSAHDGLEMIKNVAMSWGFD